MNEMNFDNVDWNTVSNEPTTDVVEDIDLGAESLTNTVKPVTLDQAFKVNPSQHAQNVKIQREAGIPISAVESDPAGVSTDLKLKKINFDEMSKRAPGTSGFLSDYNNAVIAQDDIDVMQVVEDTLRSIPGGFVEGAGMAVEGTGRFIEAGGRMVGRGLDFLTPDGVSESIPNALKEFNQLIAPANLIKRQGALLKTQAEDIADVPAERENIATDIAGGLGQVAGQIALSLLNPQTGVGAMFAQGVDQQGERQEASGTEGQSTTSDLALFAGGGVTAVSEKIGLDALLNRIPPAIKNKVVRQITDISLAGGIEAVQEVVEGIAQGVLEQITTNPDAEIFEGLDREAIAAGGTGAIVRAIVNTLTPGRVRTAEEQQVTEETKTQFNAVTLEKLNNDIAGMKMKQYDTETLKKFMESADNEQGTTVFVDAVQASLYLSDKTPEQIKQDPGLQRLQDQVNNAAALGNDVEIPMADFAADFAGTEHFDNLKEHMTLNADVMSPFRAEQSKEETRNYVQSLMAEADENVSQYVESQEIYETVKQQLVDSGQVNAQNAGVMAQVVPAWATVYAKKNGISVKEAYERSGLNIEGPQTGERARLESELALLNQPDVQQMLDMDEDAFIQAVNPEGKIIADDDIMQLSIGDLDLPETTTPVSSFNADGQTINVVSDSDDNMYAVSDDGVLGMVGPAEDNETMIDLVAESKGKGVGKELAKAYMRQNPMAPAGGFTKAGEATYRAAFRELKFERDSMLKQSEVESPKPTVRDRVRPDKNLFVAHNLSAENLIAANDLGGLAAPSIAVARADISDFSGFGEITLMADPSLLMSDKARTFNADIYSPRQPRAEYNIDLKSYNDFKDLTQQYDEVPGKLSGFDIQSLESDGAYNLIRSDAVKYHYLKLQNKAPKIKTMKVDPSVKKAAALVKKKNLTRWDLEEDVDFIAMAVKNAKDIVQKNRDVGGDERGDLFEGLYFDENGIIKSRKLSDFHSEVLRYIETGGKDAGALRNDIEKKFRTDKARNDFEAWATDQFNNMVKGKRLFKGFTDSGNRRYADYNMNNVVKEMTQALQAGEGSFYGAGSVRSAYAAEMKTITDIQKRRDEIVTDEEIEKVKEEANQVLEDALEKLKPFYKFDSDGWGYQNDAGSAIAEGNKGIREAFRLTKESKQIIDDLTGYLSTLPTSYFEAKIQRAVDFSEFSTAVVPSNVDKKALKILEDAGLKIKKYNPKKDDARAETIAKQRDVLFQESQAKDGTRGYYDPANAMIRLTEAADLSTFLHEFAHFMYEMELKADGETMQSIHNWFKRNADDVAKEAGEYAPNTTIIPRHVISYIDNGTAGDVERDNAIRRAVHEQFARGFETYLMEGKAPSVELRNAFRTFARWLTQIYKAVRGQLNVNLDDEMRKVFDAMLATDEQIEMAEARVKFQPLLNPEELSDEDREKYQKQQEKVKDKQAETLRDKLINEITRTTQKWWNDEKSDMIDEELAVLKDEKVYRAREVLSSSELKLDHATVKEMSGFQRTDKRGRTSTVIPTELRGMTAKGQQGVHPDEAAAVLGYSSGSELIQDLLTAEPIGQVAEQNAETRMLEKYGDIMNDGTIQKEADEAVQNEERGKLILQELKELRRLNNQPMLERSMMKQVAEQTIAALPYNKIFPGKYRKSEIKAAQEAAAAYATGDNSTAANAKARQAMNYYLAMEATKAKNEIDKISSNMGRYNKTKVREEIMKADGGFMEQIDKILARFEFRKSKSIKSVDAKNQDINSWMLERTEREGDALVITNAVLNELYQTHWKKVPYSELKGIYDSVRNMEHVARYANKINKLGEKVEFKKLVNEWTDHMNAVQPDRFKSQRTGDTEGRNWGRWAMAQMTKIPFMASWLDGNERAGLSHDILVQPFTDAYDAELKLWNEAGKPVMDLIENRDKADIKRHNTKVFIPEIKSGEHDGNLYGHQIIAVALNTGNESNLRKLLLGEGWADPDDEASINIGNPQLQAVLSKMTQSDWDLVQKIWDQMETLYPMLAEVHRKTTGLVPPQIEAVPVPTEYGTFKGGYYPVKYSPNRSLQALENEDKLNAQTESMFGGTMSIQASVNASATNERTGYYGPIKLSLDVVPNHFQETIHYITHHDAVRQVNKLIRNDKVAQTIIDKLGQEEYNQLKPWLNDIAKDGREAPLKTFWGSMLQRLRFGVTLGAMGFKASTGIIQISGLSNTVAEVGIGPVMQATRSILGSPETIRSAWDFAVENSKVMNHRAQTMDREIKNAMKRIEGKRGVLAAAQEMSMKHIALIQTYMVDLPTWHAAYIKSMDDFGDEQRAYRYADWVVENVQGSGVTKDMAQIMRGQSEEARMFTMFMTFFSSLWNLERDLVKGAKSGKYSVTNVGAKAMFLFTIPVLFEMLMRGEFGGDEEPEEQLQTMLTKTAMFPLQSVPFVRDVVNAVGGDYGYNITPLQSLLEQGTQTIPKIVTSGFTDDEITKGQAKGASKFAGAALGIPGTGQAWATGEHLYDVIEEGEDFTVHQLLFGPKKD